MCGARARLTCPYRAVQAGYYDIAVASGVETMSQDAFTGDVSGAANPKARAATQTQRNTAQRSDTSRLPLTHTVPSAPQIFENAAARACLLPMGITSENVAQRFGVSREAQDALAAASHARAAAARSAGRFSGEIVPVRTSVKDPATGERTEVVVSEDDGIRAGVTAAQLAALKPAFKAGGSTTAGNASQVSDGAAAVLVARRSAAQRLGLPVLATWRSFAAVGCDPAVMGVGPAVAIPRALALAGVRSVNEIALFELNEAFASQAAYCARTLGLDPARVNVNGGAIALGHPLGATGARCVATLLAELARRGPEARLGVISMCIGSGMGAAAVLEKA